MWHMDGDLIVSLIHLSKKSKFCFFNNDNIELGKMQRWSATIYSHNLEYAAAADVDWGKVDELIQNTIEAQN
jgi:hypothetical protein